MSAIASFQLILITFILASPEGKAAEGKWIKVTTPFKSRYFYSESDLQPCGIFESVEGTLVTQKGAKPGADKTVTLQSCLDLKGSMDFDSRSENEDEDERNGEHRKPDEEYFGIKAVVGKNLHILRYSNKRIYSFPADKIATPMAYRFENGEVALPSVDLCQYPHKFPDGRGESDASTLTKLPPFPSELKGNAQFVRYHAFEYHMACGT